MKQFLLALILLLPFCIGASTYSQNGLIVTTNLDVQQYQTLSLTTGGAVTTYVSYLTIEIRNTAPTAILNVSVSEDLSTVEGILNYSPSASLLAPRTPAWHTDSIGPSQSFVVSAALSGKRDPSLASALPAPTVSSAFPAISLSVPMQVAVGDKYALVATYDGNPVPGAEIDVTSPTGEKSVLVTDANGTAEFTATSGGYYTYLVRNYPLEQYASTKANSVEPMLLPTTSAAVETNTQGGINFGAMLPFVLGLVVLAAVIFVALSYLSGRREEEGAQPPQQPAYAYSYTQEGAAAQQPSAPQQPTVDAEATKDLLASRRNEPGKEQERAPAEAEPDNQSAFEELGEYTSVYSDGEKENEGKRGAKKLQQPEEDKEALEGSEYTQIYGEDEEGLESSIDEELAKAEEEEKKEAGAEGEPEPKEEQAPAQEVPEEKGEEKDWEEEQSSIQRQLELIRAKLAKSRQLDKDEEELEGAERSFEEEEPASSTGKFAIEEEEEEKKEEEAEPEPEAGEEAEEPASEAEEEPQPKPARVQRPLARYSPANVMPKGKPAQAKGKGAQSKLKTSGKKRK